MKERKIDLVNSVGITDTGIRDALRIGNNRTTESSVFFAFDLNKTPTKKIWDEIFSKRGGQRKKVRKAEKAGLRGEILSSSSDFDAFYRIYYSTVKRAGGRPRDYRFLSGVWRELSPHNFKVLVIKDSSGVLLAGLGFHTFSKRQSAHAMYSGYETDFGEADVNFANYWNLMLWCEENGFPRLNLGTTPAETSSGLYEFKRRLGAEPVRRFNVTNILAPRSVYSVGRGVNRLAKRFRKFARKTKKASRT